jgi:putative transposase
VKCEEVYLNDYRDVADARAAIGIYLDKYNRRRPHQTLGFQTPEAFFEFEMEKLALKAA